MAHAGRRGVLVQDDLTQADFAHHARFAVVSLCLVQFVDVLGVTLVVTTLPRMLDDVGAPAALGTLIATGYAMCFGGLLMFGARLGDRFGHRRIILASLGVFALGATITAIADSVVWITVGRCLQGAAAAGSVPSALRLLTTVTAEGAPRQRAIAAWSAAGAAAGASGFVVGGIVSDLTSWRVIFWGYLPLAAAMAASLVHSVPADTDADADRPLNASSAAIFTGCVMAFVVGTTLIPDASRQLTGLLLIVLAAGLGVVFVLHDQRSRAPLLPPALLRFGSLREGVFGATLNTATTSSSVTLVTLYLQNTLGISPLQAAATLLPFSLAVIVGSSAAAALLRHQRPQLVAATGLALIALSNGGYIAAGAFVWAFGVCAALGGAGIGLSSVATTGLGTSVDIEWRGTASGMINTAAQLGTAVGIAVLLLLATATTGAPSGSAPAPAVAWLVAGLVAAAGAVFFWSRR